MTSECNINCNCDPFVFKPVCGSDDVNYFSPCFAGCTEETIPNDAAIVCLPSLDFQACIVSGQNLTCITVPDFRSTRVVNASMEEKPQKGCAREVVQC